MHRPRSVAFALFVALLWASCQAVEGERPRSQRPNFLFIVVDTLRADFLQHAGGPRPTPNIDALQQESTRFANAYSTSSWTLPALASLLTGQIGSQHGVVHWGSPLGVEQKSLIEILRDGGYATAGFVANILLERASGFDRGFDTFKVLISPIEWIKNGEDLFSNAPASLVNEGALAWLAELREAQPDRPFFAYLHYMEPHTPYRCMGGTDACQIGAAALSRQLVEGDWTFTQWQRKLIRILYGSEVMELDRALGELLASLADGGFLENTWIVLTADHGELLGEGGRFLHGESLERAEIRVPLLFRAPSKHRAVVETPVSLIDVAPTVLALAEVEAPPTFRGRSLAAALRGDVLPPRPVIAELFPRSEAIPRHRLVVVSGNEEFTLTPSGAITLRSRGEPDAVPRPASKEELDRALGELHDWVDFSNRTDAASPEISAEMQERLRALGYAN